MDSKYFYEAFRVYRFGNSEHYRFDGKWILELSRVFCKNNSKTKIRYIMRRNKYKNQYKWE